MKELKGTEHQIYNCYICITAKSFDYPRTPLKRKKKESSFSPKIKVGLIAAQDEAKIPMLEQLEKHSNNILLVCSKCHQQIGKGLRHKCIIKNVASNILNSIDTLPDKETDQIASGLLKKS